MSTRFLSRRELLMSLPAMSVARAVGAQSRRQFKVRALNHITISVKDPQRTIEFYQTLFGMPIQARQGPGTTCLRVGTGPQFLTVGRAAGGDGGISHFCVSIEDFSVDRVLNVLADHGITKSDSPGGLSGGPLKVRVRMRGADRGGAAAGTPEIYIGDPDGTACQVPDPTYGGGAGVLGDVMKLEPAPKKGLLALEDFSHVTVYAKDAARSDSFYQDLFGLGIRANQGPTGLPLAVGPGVQFLMFTGGGGGADRKIGINHACYSMRNFNVETVQKALESVGVKPRAGNGPAGPMEHYVTRRMENRGGAKEGTPELHFTDPDGIIVQIQDVSYCGGGGVLGNMCPPL